MKQGVSLQYHELHWTELKAAPLIEETSVIGGIRSSYLPVLGELRGICPQSRLMCRCERGALARAHEPRLGAYPPKLPSTGR